jgi:Na+-transporting NADH:ubiquinone oxidoreductase subunit NqrB
MTRPQRLLNEVPVVVVLAVGAAGLVLTGQGYWRRGLLVVAASLLLAALLRLALPTRRAGLLAVRSKLVDVLTLGGFGSAMLLLASVVPPPR